MKYLFVKQNDYINFLNENKSDRLEKHLKLYTVSKSKLFNKTNEIFDKPIYTNYKIEINNDNNILISFYSKNNNKYRLDIFKIIEKDELINHISFSDYNKEIDDYLEYEELLNNNEIYDILNKIHFILKDLVTEKIIDNNFCIGGTKLKSKNNLYKYLLYKFAKDGFKKLNTSVYDTGYGLYFNI